METPTGAEIAFAHWLYEEELERQRQVVKARQYHDGDQPTFLTDRARAMLALSSLDDDFCLNVTRGVIEAVTERLLIVGFKCIDAATAIWAWQSWQADRLDAKQNEVHEAAVRDGESFIIVDWDAERQRVTFIPHERYTDPQVGGSGQGCKATYLNDDPNQPMQFASKRWVEYLGNGQARQRLTIYYPDRIEKYMMAGQGQWTPIDAQTMRAEGDSAWPLPWVRSDGRPLGIPVVHFKNQALRPEAYDELPIQNAINKALIDTLVAGDVTAFRIFVARGFIPTTDGQAPRDDESNWLELAPGQIVGTTKSANETAFSAIDGAPLDPLLNLLEKMVLWGAVVTRTPVNRYQFSGQVAAEGTLKQQSESLLAKIELKQIVLGDAWEDAMTVARRLQNEFGGGDQGQLLDEEAPIQSLWKNAEKRDRLQELQGLQIEKDALEVPVETLWARAGYQPDEIEQMKAQRVNELKTRLQISLADTVTGLTQ